MEEKQKITKGTKIAMIFAFITIVLLIFAIFYDENPTPKYSVRREKPSDIYNKAEIEIVLTKKEPINALENIANHYFKKYNSKKNIFIWYYLTDTQKLPYAYSHSIDKKLDGVKIEQPIYGNLDWFVDSLKNFENYTIKYKWQDTLQTPFVNALISNGQNYIFINGEAKSKTLYKDYKYDIKQQSNGMFFIFLKDTKVPYPECIIETDGTLKILDVFDGHTAMIINQY